MYLCSGRGRSKMWENEIAKPQAWPQRFFDEYNHCISQRYVVNGSFHGSVNSSKFGVRFRSRAKSV